VRLADTDVLIDLLNRTPEAVAWVATLTERPSVPSLVKLELLDGCRNAKEQREAMRFLEKFPTVYATREDQERAFATFAGIHLSNAIGPADILIAETAIGLGATLCSLNEKHFKMVPGLKLEVPYRKAHV
jgi:predicted nucleic acid-binding protein